MNRFEPTPSPERASAQHAGQHAQNGLHRKRHQETEDGEKETAEDIEMHVHRRTADLDAANGALRDEIVERERLEAGRQELMRQLVRAQEEERRRISRELHDEIGQYLTALMLGLKSLEAATREPEHMQTLKSLQAITGRVGQEIHELALQLRPTALDDLGLLRTLANYVAEWSARTGIAADFHSAGWIGERLPSHIESTIYRIVQEALTNIVKHANARQVSVIIERRADKADVIIEDDGRGFPVEVWARRDAPNQLGLLGMKERAALVGGQCNVESSVGKGTTVFVRIPVTPATAKGNHG